jgi:predicted GH43/DUF377 family glycosyl hydrolase
MSRLNQILLISIAFALFLGACATLAEPTPTLAPTETPLPRPPQFDLTVHTSRTDVSLGRLTGVTWEGGYVWTPFVVHEDDTYYLFYNGYSTFTKGVGVATSQDGIKFERIESNPVLEPAEDDERVIFSPLVYKEDDGTWVMFIVNDERRTGLAGDRVLRYTAPAAEGPWEGGDVVYQAPNPEHWTHEIVIRSLVQTEEGILLAFDARHDDTISIGLMRSADGLSFELLSDQPVFTKGAEGDWDQDAVSAPVLYATDEGYEMLYIGLTRNSAGRFTSFKGLNIWMGYATSRDGLNWERHPENPVIQLPEEAGTPYLSGMKVDDIYRIYYVYGQGAFGIASASFTIE